jgi:hypothetical protein
LSSFFLQEYSKPDAAETLAAVFRTRAVGVVPSSMMRARVLVRRCVLVLAVLVIVADEAGAQDGFKITYEVDRSRTDRARLTGRVVNERSEDVFEVNVTAEALDARGKVLARGIAYVDSKIGRGDARPFSMSVPTVAGTTSFRVVVSSYRAGFSTQGP